MTGHRQVRPWELLGERPRADGWIPLVTRTYRMPDGSVSDWDVHLGRDTVAVLALTDDLEVVLVREYRPGPDQILTSLPGGLVDAGEDVPNAGARELREETGFAAREIAEVGSCWAFSTSTWRRHVVIARGAYRVGAPESWGGDEYCEPVLIPLLEYRAHLRAGEGTNTDLGYLALDAAGLL
jgi:ADP-ribose pyrophosphatase